MTANVAKIVGVVVLALTLIVAILIDSSNKDWSVPLITLLIGYVVGNTRVTNNSPIIEKP